MTPQQFPPLQVNDDTGQAYMTINGRDHILGSPGSEIAKAEHDRLMAEYRASGYSATYGLPLGNVTVAALISSYLAFARSYYGPSNRSEWANMEAAVRRVRQLYGHCLAIDFGPLQLKAIRQLYIDDGGARTYINDRIKRIVRMFRWGVSEGLIPPSVPQALSMVPGLRRGRTTAREPKRILPADPAMVDATLPHLHPVVKVMVALQRLTGARPGEICILRPCDVDRTGDVWEYRPSSHKNANRGKERVIYIGPQGQEILRPYLLRPADIYCFSAAQVSDDNRANIQATRPERTTPRYPCEAARVEREKEARRQRGSKTRLPGKRYRTGSYAIAIRRGCVRAFGDDGPKWSPNQLRHLAATEIRKRFGLEAAQIILGHAQADVTQIYAERDSTVAIRIAKEVG